MSQIAIIKISDEDLTEDEGRDVIRQVLEAFDLRATVVNNGERFSVEQPKDELDHSLRDLMPLVDDDYGTIGYIQIEHAQDIVNHLNGEEPQ